MRKSLGGLLCLLLGAVLIVTGTSGTAQLAGGGTPTPTCSIPSGVPVPCPVGTITVTEATSGPVAPPASWSVTITSPNCTDPSGNTINQTLSVPNGGSATSGSLFVYTSPLHSTTCSYTLVEAAVAGFTATFSPPSPVSLPFNGGKTGNDRAVDLTNVSAAATTSASGSGSSSATSSAPASSSSAASSTIATSAQSSASASSQPLAATGTRTSIGPSLYAGIALCLLGVFLLVAARRGRNGTHRG